MAEHSQISLRAIGPLPISTLELFHILSDKHRDFGAGRTAPVNGVKKSIVQARGERINDRVSPGG